MAELAAIAIPFSPTLWQVGPVAITWHGLFTAVGTLLGVWLGIALARRAGFTEDDGLSAAMWGVIGGVIGARLFHVADQWSLYASAPANVIRINDGGLAIWGAVILGPVAGAIYARLRGLEIGRLADVAAVALPLGLAVGRIGDLATGEHHGVPAPGFPLAITYTNPATLGQPGLPVQPAVGYEIVLNLLIFLLVAWLARAVSIRDGRPTLTWNPRTRGDGALFWLFLALYGVVRLVTGFYRQETVWALGLTQSELIGVVAAMVGVWGLVFQLSRVSRRAAREQDPVQPAP